MKCAVNTAVFGISDQMYFIQVNNKQVIRLLRLKHAQQRTWLRGQWSRIVLYAFITEKAMWKGWQLVERLDLWSPVSAICRNGCQNDYQNTFLPCHADCIIVSLNMFTSLLKLIYLTKLTCHNVTGSVAMSQAQLQYHKLISWWRRAKE